MQNAVLQGGDPKEFTVAELQEELKQDKEQNAFFLMRIEKVTNELNRRGSPLVEDSKK